MEQIDFLPLRALQAEAARLVSSPALARTNMTLSPAQAALLVRQQQSALRETGRLAFSGGTLSALAETFCDSPFLQREEWPEVLAELTEIFYALKNETGDRLGDGTLMRAMAARFNGGAGGSLDALAATPSAWFLRFSAREETP